MGGKARLALIAFILAASAVPGSAVRAGDTIVGGDCWQAGTPLICRNVWVDNNFLRVRLIDQLSNAALTSKAEVARSNWTSAAGPQILSWNSQVNDTWIYLKRNDGLGVPNGVTFNCNGTLVPVCSDQARAMMIVWTEIYVPLGNKDNAKGTSVFAHEIGHALGLFHHGNGCTPLMSAGLGAAACVNPPIAPQATDIGGLPPCGGNVQHGIRCIYKWD